MATAAAAAARSPSLGQARPCCAMRRSADSSPFKPADCPQRSASFSKGGGGVCGCHASLRRRSFGEKENDQQRDAAARTPKAARASGSKNFMAPTISATSKAVAASPSPRKKVLGERNEDAHLFAPFSSANLAHKPKGPPEAGSARRLRLSFDGPAPAPPPAAASHGSRRSFDGEDTRIENLHHHAEADSDSVVDAEQSRGALYDPKTNYTSPRPRFLHYKPNPRIEMYRHGGGAARRLDEGLASESSEESVTTTTDDDLEEEQEQAQQKPEESSAQAAPSEAGDAAAVPAAVTCVFQPEPAPGSPRAPVQTSEPAVMSQPARVLATEPRATSPRTRAAVPAAMSWVVPLEPAPGSLQAAVLTSEPAVMSPPARVLATEPRATSPRTRALTPEPELGASSARPPAKKRSKLRFMFPLALVLFMAAAFVCVSLPPDSPIMSNTALSKASSFLSVQELHPVELAAWLKQWSSSSLDSITSYWEAFASTQEQEYFGPHFAANLSAASADADHGADFYYNFAEASPMPSEETIGAIVFGEQLKFHDVVSASNTELTAVPVGDVVVEEESIDDGGVEEESDASEYYKVEEELDVEISEEQSIDAAVAEDSDASGYYNVAEELDLEISEEAPDNYGEEMTSVSQNLDTPSQSTGEPEQDVETAVEETIGAIVLGEQLKFHDVVSASNTELTAVPVGDVVVEEESIDDGGVEEESDASEYYKVEEELDVEISEEQSIDAAVAEDSDASGYYNVAEELDLEISEEAPDNYGEEMTSVSQNLDTPSQSTGEPEQDVETDESEDDHTIGKEGQEAYRGLKSDSSMWPSYLDKISKPAAAGVALLVVLLSAGIAVLSMRKNQAQVAPNTSAPAEEPEQAENQSVPGSSEGHLLVKPSQSVSGSSEGHLVKPSQFQSSVAEETERFGDSVFSQYSSSLSSGQGRRRKTKEEESLGLEPTSRRESTSQSTSSFGSFTTYEKISAKKKNKDDEAMTPVRRSSRLRTVKSPEA